MPLVSSKGARYAAPTLQANPKLGRSRSPTMFKAIAVMYWALASPQHYAVHCCLCKLCTHYCVLIDFSHSRQWRGVHTCWLLRNVQPVSVADKSLAAVPNVLVVFYHHNDPLSGGLFCYSDSLQLTMCYNIYLGVAPVM